MNRDRMLARLEDRSTEWDLLVIGGGATGLGTALDAATRGYRTVLLEQADFGAGTSSRSTKLIHGGVRYLRNGELGLVRDSLRERGRLLKNAPNLVHPLPFVVPAYRAFDRYYHGAGLTAYDLLAGKLGIESTRHLGREATLERVPNLAAAGLHGGTHYWDGQFDDARLCVALAVTAARHDAVVLNHVRVDELVKDGGKVRGATATDRLSGQSYRLAAKAVVNATGVFSDAVRRLDDSAAPALVEPSQGIHLVLDDAFLGGETAVMIPKTDDGRVLFAIPWHGRALLGTTDTPGVPVSLDPKPLDAEIDYLLEHAARYFTKAPARDDIRASFAGLRPLVRPPDAEKRGGVTAKFSRDHSLFVSDSGLVTIAGGKWTTYRRMAQDTVDRAADVAGLERRPCVTADLALEDRSGADGLKFEDAEWLEKLDPALPYRLADVVAGVRFEMAQTLEDILARRTRLNFLDRAAARKCAHRVVRLMADELGKDEAWIAAQLKALREAE